MVIKTYSKKETIAIIREINETSLQTILNHGSITLLNVAEFGSIILVTVPEHGSICLDTVA